MDKKSCFSVLELKQLLIDILEHGPNVCIRIRLIGEMWQENLVRVVGVTETRVLVYDEIRNKLISYEYIE